MTDLKEVFELPTGGNVPVRSPGSRWINHKRKALQCVVDRCGAYITHLTALTEDGLLKSEYNSKVDALFFGCALYVDILKPPSLLSLHLQGSGLYLVSSSQ